MVNSKLFVFDRSIEKQSFEVVSLTQKRRYQPLSWSMVNNYPQIYWVAANMHWYTFVTTACALLIKLSAGLVSAFP